MLYLLNTFLKPNELISRARDEHRLVRFMVLPTLSDGRISAFAARYQTLATPAYEVGGVTRPAHADHVVALTWEEDLLAAGGIQTEAVYCPACDVHVNGQAHWEDHKTGTHHAKNVRRALEQPPFVCPHRRPGLRRPRGGDAPEQPRIFRVADAHNVKGQPWEFPMAVRSLTDTTLGLSLIHI